MEAEGRIQGGYILTPRNQHSEIMHAPPHVREIYAFLVREANYQDNQYGRFTIKRGQLFRSYSDIKEGTKWFIGWRKMTYNENQVKKTMKFLREVGRIATKKEPGGVLITICNYDYYQTPESYEGTMRGTEERTIVEPGKNHGGTTYNKKDIRIKNENKKEGNEYSNSLPDFIDQILNLFIELAGDYKVVNKHRERKAISALIKLHKTEFPQQNTEDTIRAFRTFFQACVNIEDDWLRDNMSPTLMANKYNEIKNKIKNRARNGNSIVAPSRSDECMKLADIYDNK